MKSNKVQRVVIANITFCHHSWGIKIKYVLRSGERLWAETWPRFNVIV